MLTMLILQNPNCKIKFDQGCSLVMLRDRILQHINEQKLNNAPWHQSETTGEDHKQKVYSFVLSKCQELDTSLVAS